MSAVMFQGTGSDVGKSVLVAGLARALVLRGLSVRPFKPQNMSNNAAVTSDGGEIGRAQDLQARACGVEPTVHMNPVLLKPQSEIGSQVVVHGKVVGAAKAADYQKMKPTLLPAVLESFERLQQEADRVLVEGAGSAAEVNLRAGDIANMGFAQAADVPVVLIADIDRGGVIASVVGTHAILQPEEVARVRGYIINKFRGDPRLFDSGVEIITRKTGWPCLGVVPWFQDASKLPAEDAVAMQGTRRFNESGVLRVAVPVLSRIANFDDFDPLIAEPQVSVNFVAAGEPIPADIDLVILPGSKSTIGDLDYLREQGWHIDIAAHVRRGGAVLGICGGYQMLGKWIDDPNGIEGPAGGTPGLGLLDVKTVLTPRKTLEKVSGTYVGIDASLSGYEIHIGETGGPGTEQPMMTVNGVPHGARAADGLIEGCYLHGMFERDAFRKAYLSRWLDGTLESVAYERQVDETLDGLANHLETHVRIDEILAMASPPDS